MKTLSEEQMRLALWQARADLNAAHEAILAGHTDEALMATGVGAGRLDNLLADTPAPQ